jgi:hypothetical protein
MLPVAVLASLVLQQQAVSSPAREVPVPPAADTMILHHPNARVPPRMVAVRAAEGAPRIDGRLDEPVWALAEPASGFRQQTPKDGDSATERTEVRIVYDDEAVYIGARMFDSEPSRVTARLGRRDNGTQSDIFEVDFDSYHDHRTTFQFYANPVGVRQDRVSTNDFPFGDEGWDPVWDVATQRDSLGWTAEMRIPLSQLRFPNTPQQVWGINFFRYIQRKGENDVWSYSAQTEQGYASYFGHLLGMANLPQPRRFELLPYVAGVEERTQAGSAGNPFNDGSRETGRAGVDFKYGLTSNLTLDATVNPDFGQVEADPAVINLSAYETYFQERRPFFVEGAGIFSGISPGGIPVNGPQYVYSRRIGRSPQGFAQDRGPGSYTDMPNNTTILGAGKLSGRTAGGWSVAMLEAVTQREYAKTDSAGVRFKDQVEPLTSYSAFRAKRESGAGATTLGFTATAVNRSINDAGLDFLPTAAYAGGVDYGHRFNHNRYSIFASLGGSYIRGDTIAIQAAQLSSARYYQRPDAGYLNYDPSRTSLSGWNANLGASKDEGALTYAGGINASSPGFEINDLGFQGRSDRIQAMARAGRRWTRPGKVFRNAQLGINGNMSWDFGGDRTGTSVSAYGYGEFLNYWSVNAGTWRGFRVVDPSLLRGGPAGLAPSGWEAYAGVGSDYRKSVQLFLNYDYGSDGTGGWWHYASVSVSARPGPNISLSTGPSYSYTLSTQQYVTAVPDAAATATFGQRYVFAEILQHSLDLTTRVSVTLTPNLSVQFYAQPFVATGDYRRFRSLVAPRTLDFTAYPDSAALGNLDFAFHSLRGNAVLRWEYRPGSTLFLVWTTSCSASGPAPVFDASNDLRHLCQGRSDNVFAVKMNYWLSL